MNLQNIGADFVLKMLSEQKLNQVNVQYVVGEATTLISQSVKQHMLEVVSTLKERGLDTTCLTGLLESKEDPFVSLHTQYGQNKYFASHFGKLYISLSTI